MLSFLQVLIMLLAVLSIAVALPLAFNVKAGFSPVFVMGSLTAFVTVAAMMNLAYYAVWVFLLLALLSVIYSVFRIIKNKKLLSKFACLGFVSFVMLSLFFVVLFSIRTPLFYEWDEFSFWGTAARIVSEFDLLYTVAENNMIGVTHPPALIIASYIFNFFGEFAPFRTYLGYNILLFSVFGAIISIFEKKNAHLGVVSMLVLLCSPFIALNLYGRPIFLLPGFMSAYADYPMAILFAGAILIYLCERDNKIQVIIASCILLFVLTLSKEMGFAFGLLAAGIISADLLIVERKTALIKRVGMVGALMATPVVAFAGWSAHLAAAAGINRFEVGGEQDLGMVEMMLTGLRELFLPFTRTDKFNAVFDNLILHFLTNRVIMFGSGIIVFAIVTAIMAAVLLFSEDKRRRMSAIIFYIFSSLGCLAYNIFLGFTYVYIFKGDLGINLTSYSRYIMPYYIGWLIVAFVFALFSLRDKCRLKKFVQPALVLGGCGVFALTHLVTPSEYIYLGYPDSYFSAQRELQQKIEYTKDYIASDDLVYYLHSHDNGFGWFTHYYYFLPTHIDYSGGGDLTRYGVDGLPIHLAEIDADILFIDYFDPALQEQYGHMFSDNMDGYLSGSTYLYSIENLGDTVMMHPIDLIGQ